MARAAEHAANGTLTRYLNSRDDGRLTETETEFLLWDVSALPPRLYCASPVL